MNVGRKREEINFSFRWIFSLLEFVRSEIRAPVVPYLSEENRLRSLNSTLSKKYLLVSNFFFGKNETSFRFRR